MKIGTGVLADDDARVRIRRAQNVPVTNDNVVLECDILGMAIETYAFADADVLADFYAAQTPVQIS
jgi:hypothetical protein